MADNIRTEFEEYVKNLSSEICKGVLLTKMEDLYHKFQGYYEYYSKISDNLDNSETKIRESSEAFQHGVVNLKNSVEEMKDEIASYRKNVSQDISDMREHSEGIFTQIEKINLIRQEEFIQGMGDFLSQYKTELSEELDRGHKKIADKLAEVVTSEHLLTFINAVEENTKFSQKMAEFINNSYKEEVEKNFEKIRNKNNQVQNDVNQAIKESVDKVLEEMSQGYKKSEGAIGKSFIETTEEIRRVSEAFYQRQEKLAERINNVFVTLMQSEHKRWNEEFQKQVDLVKVIEPRNEIIKSLDVVKEYSKIQLKLLNQREEEKQKLLERLTSGFLKPFLVGINTMILMALLLLMSSMRGLTLEDSFKIFFLSLGGSFVVGVFVKYMDKKILEKGLNKIFIKEDKKKR